MPKQKLREAIQKAISEGIEKGIEQEILSFLAKPEDTIIEQEEVKEIKEPSADDLIKELLEGETE